jgi:hypothetical protein
LFHAEFRATGGVRQPVVIQASMVSPCKAPVKRYTVVVTDLHDVISMACHARLVAENVVTREEDTVTRNHLAWLEKHDITHGNIIPINVLLASVTQDLDKTTFGNLVVPLELPCDLSVVQQNSEDNDEDCSNGSNAPGPVH